MFDIAEILIELCSAPGPAGFEGRVAERCMAMLSPYMDETRTDVLGNVIGVRRCGRENAVKLLFDAHIDEIGLIITGAEEGFLRFAALGGLDERALPASGVEIMSDPPIYGVICVQPPHVLKKEDTDKVMKIEDLYIDIGMDQDSAMQSAPPGTPAVLSNGARRFGNNLICGKALDDRAGFAAILYAQELLKDTKLDVDLYVMASVQEEVGTRGTIPGAFAIEPDYCVVVDVDHAKTPDSKPFESKSELGRGVIVTRGPNMNSRFTEAIRDIAVEQEIKHQISVEPGGNSGTNARAIQISRNGIATAILGLPLRYMHGAQETASLEDIENAARLLSAIAVAGSNMMGVGTC